MTEGVDYYVSTDGDDSNAGTESDPLGSIHEAVSRVSAGETISVRGGEYQYENGNPVVIDSTSGSSSTPITITSPSGERPHFRWEGGWTDWDMEGGFELVNGASHWIFEGLEVSETPSVGIRAYEDSRGLTFRDMLMHDNSNTGIQLSGEDHEMIAVESFGNYDEPNGGEDADGLVMEGVDNGLIANCQCYNNSDDGIDLWESSSVVVRDTWCHNNGRGDDGDGNGIKSANTNVGGNNDFIRCVASGNRNHGFRAYSPRADKLANCTSYNNGSHGYAAIHGGDHNIVNCIEYQSSSGTSFHSGVNDRYNTWNLAISDPMFASTDTSTETFLRLAEGSPAIDAGTDVGLEYSGDGPDLGAYEYATETTPDDSAWGPVTIYYHTDDEFVEVAVKNT